MLQYSHFLPTIQRSSLFKPVLLLLLLSATWETTQAAIPDRQNQMLQFTASGHVLEFHSDGFYVATDDHMLHVGFLGSIGAIPERASDSKDNNRSQPKNKVTYTDLWSGINLLHDAVGGGITESTWEITPGSSPQQIRLHYNAPVSIEKNGSLKIDFATGWMHESAPIAWQEIDGRHHPVEVTFHLLETQANEAIVGFKVGHYDHDHPLLIDPTMTWNTFMGSATYDTGNSIVIDDEGDIYVAGYSDASWGIPVNAHMGDTDAFVAKLDANGNLKWHTFMGSSSYDEGHAIALGNNGVYIIGESGGTWGGEDVFIAMIDGNGNRLWHRFIGCMTGEDKGNSITVDGNGDIYLAGNSDCQWGNPVTDHSGGDDDAFVAKLDSSGDLIWNTFMGSAAYDSGTSLAIDEEGNVFVAGYSYSSWGTPANTFSGSADAFLVKLDASGNRLWNTFLGSSSQDYGGFVVIENNNNVYLSGDSSASWGSPIRPFTEDLLGGDDVFMAKLNSDGYLQWNTFLGAIGSDTVRAIVTNNTDTIYMTGSSEASWESPINRHVGGTDAFIATLDFDGNFLWNTFMGSEGYDSGRSVVLDSNDSVIVVGNSTATWGRPINNYTGDLDVFVAKPRTTRCTLIMFKKNNEKNIPLCI